MVAMKWMAPLCLAGALGAGALGVEVAGATAADAPAAVKELRDTPLGRLICGNIGRWMTFRSEANVTDQQRQKARAVLSSHKAEIGDVVKDLVAKRRALRGAVRAETRDEAAIRKAGEDLGKSIGDAAVLGSKVREELKPIFTARQIDLFEKFVAERDGSVDRWLGEAFGK